MSIKFSRWKEHTSIQISNSGLCNILKKQKQRSKDSGFKMAVHNLPSNVSGANLVSPSLCFTAKYSSAAGDAGNPSEHRQWEQEMQFNW